MRMKRSILFFLLFSRLITIGYAQSNTLTYITPVTNVVMNQNIPIGSIPYSFTVNPNGSSSFSIPLTIPQGQMGMTPEINLI
jgi:hypothetical protein